MNHSPIKNNATVPIIKQLGAGIVEVMVLILVMGIGMLAMGKIQSMLLRDGGTANNRAIATSLAQEKLDDLRGFKWINAALATEAGEDCGNGTFCYSEIGTNAGGVENGDGSLKLSNSIVGANATFTRSWAVADNTDFKVITVTVSWADPNCNPNCTVVLQGAVYALDTSVSTLATNTGSYGSDSPGPQVHYTPIGVPDAVPIDVGDGRTKESTKPAPEVNQSGEIKSVKFDAVSYNSASKTVEREEFLTVNCVCKYEATNASQPTASRMVWDGDKLAFKEGPSVSKKQGSVNTTGPNGVSGQPTECDLCCAEHHDTNATDANGNPYPQYDPARPVADYDTTSGDHKHYWWVNVNDHTQGLQESTSVYLEACRFKRVDGFWKLWQDWQMKNFVAMDYTYLQTDANLTAYTSLITDVVHHEIDNTYSTFATLPSRDFTINPGATRQILARGVFVDTIYQADLPTTVDSAYYSAIQGKISGGDTDWLSFVPFYEVNMTLLIDWTTTNATNVPVTAQDIDTVVDVANDYYGSYSRGRVTGSTAGTNATITAQSRWSNSALTGGVDEHSPSYGIDTDDQSHTSSSSMVVTVSGAATTFDISGTIVLGPSSGGGAGLGNCSNYAITAETSCTTTAKCSVAGNQLSYTCTVNSGWSGTITPTRNNYELDTIVGTTVPAPDGSHTPSRTYTNVTAGTTGQNYQVCKTACTSP